ncbi:MAG: RHS repeat-associated core domain-containing protein, partial [Myxococcota bacterium]
MTWTHDSLGRPLTRVSDDGTNTFTYDVGTGAIGKLSSATSADGVTTEFEFDLFGRPVVSRWSHGGSSHEIGTEYDALSRPYRIRYPTLADNYQLIVRTDFDPIDARASQVVNETDQMLLRTIAERDYYDRITAESRGAIALTNTFDPVTQRLRHATAMDMSDANQQTIVDVQYDYYPGGQLQTRTDTSDLGFPIIETATYDGLSRLATWNVKRGNQPAKTRFYSFNESGTLNAVNDLIGLTNVGTEAYTYPPSGGPRPHAVETLDDKTFAYDDIGRLESVLQGSDLIRQVNYTVDNLPRSGTSEGQSFSFLYDAFGRRFQKTTSQGTTTYVGGLYEHRDFGGDSLHVFYAAGSQLDYRLGDNRAAVSTVVTDGRLGSPIARVDSNGVERFFSTPYGKRIDAVGFDVDEAASSSMMSTGFTSHEHDRILGWTNMRGRIFDPSTRSFLTPDPVDSVAGRYRYVDHDPFNAIDPSGFQKRNIQSFGRAMRRSADRARQTVSDAFGAT